MTSRSKTEPNPSSVKLMFAVAVNRCPDAFWLTRTNM